MNSPSVAAPPPDSSPPSATPSDEIKAENQGGNALINGIKDDPPRDTTRTKQDNNDDDAAQELTFPQQLMNVINEETLNGTKTDEGERVIEWAEDGKSFVIRDKAKLETEVLPRHFLARCKYMSFVRKLYRWGFRQIHTIERRPVGKSTDDRPPDAGPPVFQHANFVKGDMKRCLMMRSIVKKVEAKPQLAAAQQQLSLASTAMLDPFSLTGMAASEARFPPSMLQAYGASGAYGMGGAGSTMNGLMGGAMMNGMGGQYGMGGGMNRFAPPLFPQQARQVTYPPLDQSGNNGLMNCQGGLGLNSQGGGMGSAAGGMVTSKDMFDASLRLERMERMGREQQQQMQQRPNMGMPPSSYDPTKMMGSNGDNGYGSNVPPPSSSSFNSSAMSGSNNFGSSSSDRDNISHLELASKIMKQDPSLEPWRAMEIARQLNNSC